MLEVHPQSFNVLFFKKEEIYWCHIAQVTTRSPKSNSGMPGEPRYTYTAQNRLQNWSGSFLSFHLSQKYSFFHYRFCPCFPTKAAQPTEISSTVWNLLEGAQKRPSAASVNSRNDPFISVQNLETIINKFFTVDCWLFCSCEISTNAAPADPGFRGWVGGCRVRLARRTNLRICSVPVVCPWYQRYLPRISWLRTQQNRRCV